MGRLLLSSGQVSVILSAVIGTSQLRLEYALTYTYCSIPLHTRALPIRICATAAIRTQPPGRDKTTITKAIASTDTDRTTDLGCKMGAADGRSTRGG
jgi:hypothetical protein